MASVSPTLLSRPLAIKSSKASSLPLSLISIRAEEAPIKLQTTRRNLVRKTLITLLGGIALSSVDSETAQAFQLGVSGPKEWLKEQKKKTADFLMAPISASRDRLNSAYNILKTGEMSFNKDYEEARRLVKVAARDCIPPEEGSFVAFQARTGVEVCTFRLILKNASSLLDDTDPTKLKADVALKNLERSFVVLDGLVESGEPGIALNSKKLGGAFVDTLTSLDKFETSVRDCLGI